MSAGLEDVRGEDRPGGEAADEGNGDQRVLLAPVPAAKRRHDEREQPRGAKRADRRGKSQAVRQHEAGEGRGAGRVDEEGLAPQNDPRSEDAGRRREQQNLEYAALDERKREGLQHGPKLTRTRLVIVIEPTACRLRSAVCGLRSAVCGLRPATQRAPVRAPT